MRDFIFNIGDSITAKHSIAAFEEMQAAKSDEAKKMDKWSGKFIAPITLIVLERRLQECSGGIQIHYLCRYYCEDGFKTEWFNEVELTAYPKPKEDL